MATNVLHYHSDGANRQAQAALAFFQYLLCDGIEESWNSEWKQYDATISVARWENCREQGYVLILTNGIDQLNIAFFEHRNTDSLCAIMWEDWTLNSPTINTTNFNGRYKDKYDTTFDVKRGEAMKMAEWMLKQFKTFWKGHNEKS